MFIEGDMLTNQNLYDSYEGFIRGNLFQNEYVPYKNYEIKTPKAKTEKEAYLFKIMELQFTINDLNIYLDLNPEDTTTFNELKKYIEELLGIEKEYVSKYGPLEICDDLKEKFNWLSNWPWEKESGMYV